MVKWFNIRTIYGLDNQISQTQSQKYAVFLKWLTFIHSSPNQIHRTITLKTNDEKITVLYPARHFSRLIWIWRHYSSGNQRSQSFLWAGRWIFWACSQFPGEVSLCAYQVTVTIIVIVPLKFWSEWTFCFKTNILRNIFTCVLNLTLKLYFWHYNKEQIESSSEKQFPKNQ